MTRTLALVLPALLLLSSRAWATDLKIVDTKGTEVTVTGASIDYSGFMATDKETQGIRVLQGEGTVTVKWADIDSLTVTGKDTSVRPNRLKIELAMRNGRKVQAALVPQGTMKLSGRSDLGDYAIDLEKIRTITPSR